MYRTIVRLLREQWGYIGNVWVGLGMAIALAGGGLIYQQVVAPPGGDVTAPTVSLTAPAAGPVSGTVAVSATASDDVGVTGVDFFHSGSSLIGSDASAPYSVSWNTTGVADAAYTLTAVASDAAGHATTSAGVNVTVSNGGGTITCNQSSTSAADFATDLAAISNGQTLCLTNAVSYGTFSGTNKTITIIAQSGSGAASPVNATMELNFGAGDSGFTIDGNHASLASATGLTISGGLIQGASNITIRKSAFNDILDLEGATTGITLDTNTHNWNSVSGGINAKIFLGVTGRTNTVASPAATIKNSEFKNGELDGMHFGDGGSGYVILNNEFANLCDIGVNHTDNIQVGANDPPIIQVRIAGNYIHETGCETQGITSYDNGSSGFVIENNVIDITRADGIELYGDQNSIVRHNTVVYHAGCSGGPCGGIDIDVKSGMTPGSGTHVYDNVARVGFNNGSTGTADHNVDPQTAIYVGPLTFHDGFLLAANSPVGKNAASDGTDAGVYVQGP